ncbi:chromosome partitioning protein [Pseudorhizobium halotolerans]|uniref:Chromosome partitioning protein n=1 Tax=Pseudorhizobium halotolerans TaxID=1233081 RepID=A0ABN7JXM0_9HYPH|nr:chromosome partitioning protein [Pseudorhizobium halotolerans]
MKLHNSIRPRGRIADRLGGPQLTDATQSASCADVSEHALCFPLSPTHVHPLSATYLQQRRVIAFCPDHRVTRAYDVLRNQIVNHQLGPAAHVLAVTAPTPKTGSSVTALNLAFSFARLAAGVIALIDTGDKTSSTTNLLNLSPPAKGGSDRGEHLIVDAAGVRFNLVRPRPGEIGITGHAELADSIELLKQAISPNIIILDLPPLLRSDKAVQLVSRADSTVLVLASNFTTRSDFDICRTFFHSDQRLQVVLNRARRHGL